MKSCTGMMGAAVDDDAFVVVGREVYDRPNRVWAKWASLRRSLEVPTPH
jgi:hypothetical protein